MLAALPTSDAIRASLRAHGAPEPERVAPLPDLGVRSARLSMGGGEWLARFVVDTPTCAPERALVAQVLWGQALPIPGPVRVLRRGLVVPGAVCPMPAGAPAAGLERSAALGAVGRALARIQGVDAGARGTLDTATGFAPRSGSWADAQRELAERDHASAVAWGTDLGPLSVALVDLVGQRSAALEAGERAVPVHGRLDPRRVFVDPEGAVVGIVGWERACAGDPEQDWAPLVLTDDFAGVVAGFGDLGAVASADGVGRLEAHVARFLLESLANLADDAPAVRARTQQAVAVAARALLEGAVGRRVADPGCALPVPSLLDAVGRGALLALGERPDPTRGSRAITALALVGLARKHGAHAEGLLRHAEGQLDRVAPAGWPRGTAVRLDRQGWLAELGVLAVSEASEDPAFGQAAAALWLVHEALEQLDWAVPTQVLLGLRAHLYAIRASRPSVAASAGGTREARALRDLAHGLLAAAAFQELAPSLGHDVAPVVEQARARLDRAARSLNYGALAAQGISGDVASALPALVDRDGLEGPAGLLPQLVLALDRLGAEVWRSVPAAAVVSLA